MLCIYIMKAVHRRLPVVVRKRLYNKHYSSVLCLFYGGVEFSDHAFTCVHESGIRGKILAKASAHWSALAGGSPASAVLRVLSQYSFDVELYTLVCKGFEACSIFKDRKVAATQIVDYVRFVVELHCAKTWLARASHQVVMEKAGLVCDSGVVSGLSHSVSSVLSDGVVRLLGVANSFAVSFGCQKPYCFFSGLGGSVQVVIDPVDSSAGALSSNLAGLGSRSGSKKIKVHIESVYLCGLSYKKTKLPGVFSGSKVDSEEAGVSKVSDVENLESTIAKEMSYMNPNASETDKMKDDVTPRKMQTRTFILEWPPKAISFASMSDNDTELVLSGAKFAGFNQLPPVILRVLERCTFEPVKLFALNVKLLNVPKKTNSDKLISIKKIFYRVDGFGGASTLSKFPGIIRFFFISEISLNKARELAVNGKILVNNNLRKTNICSNREIIVKEILVNLPKLAVESVFSKFGKIILIKMQLIGLWQKALVKFDLSEIASSVASMWFVPMDKNSISLLYILLVITTAHDFFDLLMFYNGKMCFIGYNSNSYVRNRCAVVCFENKAAKLAMTGSVPVFRSVNLHWAGLSLACCVICKYFGHIGGNCSVDGNSGSFSFGGKTWAQIAGGSSSHVVSSGLHNADTSSGTKVLSVDSFSRDVSGLNNCLAVLECFLELLTDQVSDILKRLSGVELVLLAAPSHVFPLKIFAFDVPISGLNMAVDTLLPSSDSSHLVSDGAVAELGPSSSKILTSKIKSKYDGVHIFTSGLEVGFLGTGVAIIMNNSLAHHVFKIKKMPGQIVVVWLLFKNKLLVSVVGLYAGASPGASEINSLIAKAVNSSTFVILGKNFNKNRSGRSASFKFCLSLGLVNSFTGHFLVEAPTWDNSRGIEKTIDFIFVSENLAFAVANHGVSSVSGFFDTDHSTVMVSVRLGGLLNVYLNSLHKHANKDHWKFNIKNADEAKWFCFRDCSSAVVLDIMDSFHATAADHDLDVMWSLLEKIIMNSANLLIVKIVKKLGSADTFDFDCLVKKWSMLDADKALVLVDMVDSGRKKADAIKKCIEKFCSNKGSIIRSVLGWPFRKVVLDYLVVDDELVLEPKEVKLKIDRIIEGWTRKQMVFSVLPDLWACQYAPLAHVRDDTFSGVMNAVSLNELLLVIGGLSDGKAAELFGITNKLWKHSGEKMMECLLVLLNVCLSVGFMPALWKRAWISMIPKPYD
ncbi:hypothetical protein G9A89_011768 [Geosiphon pyriformis]|nr:hypothetical protein G9A89_011768 [Geosiphon pyriformis]